MLLSRLSCADNVAVVFANLLVHDGVTQSLALWQSFRGGAAGNTRRDYYSAVFYTRVSCLSGSTTKMPSASSPAGAPAYSCAVSPTAVVSL